MSATKLAISPNKNDVPHISSIMKVGVTRLRSSSHPPAISRLKPNTTSPFSTNTLCSCHSRLNNRCLNSHLFKYPLVSENIPHNTKSTSSSVYWSLIDCLKSGRLTNIQIMSYRKKEISEYISHSRKALFNLFIIALWYNNLCPGKFLSVRKSIVRILHCKANVFIHTTVSTYIIIKY